MILRVRKRERWTTLDNQTIEDDRLSFKALGLLVYLLSRPDGWETNYRHLATTHQDGGSAILSALAELEVCGYLDRRRHRDPDTGMFHWTSVICETPDDSISGHRAAISAARVSAASETAAQEVVKTEVSTTEQLKPSLALVPAESTPDLFDEFWSVFPRRKAKADARKAWTAAVKTAKPEEILSGARRYAEERRGEPANYTKYPASWLRAGCWSDEPDPRNGRVNGSRVGTSMAGPGASLTKDEEARQRAMPSQVLKV